MRQDARADRGWRRGVRKDSPPLAIAQSRSDDYLKGIRFEHPHRSLADLAVCRNQRVRSRDAARAPSIQSITSSATVTPTFADDQVNVTAQAAAMELANPTGTALDGWGIGVMVSSEVSDCIFQSFSIV